MALDDRLSDLLVDWEQGQRDGREPTPEELCKDAPELLPIVRESIDSLKATRWMFEPALGATSVDDPSTGGSRAALHDTELPASHLTVEQFAASIFQSGLLSPAEIDELNQRLTASDLPGEAREIASRLVTEGKLTRYQASVLLKASKDPLLIDNYVILDTLDTGGMGLVFKALHRSMNRVVALKLLPAAMMSAHDTVKRFQREVHAAAALSHPNVVAAYDAHQSEEIAYLVLEYVEGTNLFRLVKEHGPLPVALAANYVRQAATGLAYLHSRGIIHRDVKPANLILADDGTVKLLDMGRVRFASAEDLSCAEMDQELTQAGIVIGTVAYMSPEQALDTRSADQRSDIYSLGCTLFFLLTGRSLYHEETGMKTLLAHREQPVPTIRQFCEEAPVSLDAVFRTMVAKRPADRLQSMSEVVAALDACVPGLATNSPAPIAQRGVTSGARPLPATLPRGWTRLRSSPLRIAIALALLAGLGVGGTYLAGILIQIRTKHGTTEVRVDDPDAEVTVKKEGDTSRDFQSLIHGRKIRDRPSAGTTAPAYREDAPGDTEQSPTNFEPKRSDIQAGPAKTQEQQALNQQQRAEAAKLWESVHGRNQKSSTDAIAFTCQKIIDNYPNTEFAARAREELAKLRPNDIKNAQPFVFGTARKRMRQRPENERFPGPAAAETKQSVDRRVANWALFFPGANLWLREIPQRPVQMTSQLPHGDIHLEGITFREPMNIANTDIDRLASLSDLKCLNLQSPSVTDDSVRRLAALQNLTRLSVADGYVTDASLPALAGMQRLSSLDLSGTQITDAGLEQLAKYKSLNDPSLVPEFMRAGTDWRFDVMGHPLPSLIVDNTRTTEAGLLKLQQALPNCAIFAWHLYPGPGNGHTLLPLPPKIGSSDRDWASWLLDHSALRCRVFADIDPETAIMRSPDLPPIDFHIQKLAFDALPQVGSVSDLNGFLFRRMGELHQLRELRIDQRLPSDTLQGLGAIKSLQRLRIGGDPYAGDGRLRAFSRLTGLTALTFEGSELTDAGVRSLAPLSGLTELSLSGHARNLHGSGFEALRGLTNLRALDVMGCGLDDEGARQIGLLTSLESLSVRETWISGKGLVAFAGLKNLKALNLRHCRRLQPEDLTPLGELTALEYLNLTECRIPESDASIRALVRALRQFKHLRFLNLDVTPETLPELQGAVGPVRINAYNWDAAFPSMAQSQPAPPAAPNTARDLVPASGESKVPNRPVGSAPRPLPPLPKPGSTEREWAKWLVGSPPLQCQLSVDVDPYSPVRKLKDIPPVDFHIERMILGPRSGSAEPNPVNASLLRRFSDLPKLRVLYINGKISPDALSGLVALPSLQELSLGDAQASDDVIKGLPAMTGLKKLRLNSHRITDAGLEHMARFKNLVELSLSGDPRYLHGSGLDALSGVATLRTLSLAGSGIQDDGVRHIAQLAGLEKLDLSGTAISGDGMVELTKLKHLKHLKLMHCQQMHSRDLYPLVDFPALEKLSLADSPIDDAAVDTLKKLKSLRTLIVERTGMTSEVIRELQSAFPTPASGESRMPNPASSGLD